MPPALRSRTKAVEAPSPPAQEKAKPALENPRWDHEALLQQWKEEWAAYIESKGKWVPDADTTTSSTQDPPKKEIEKSEAMAHFHLTQDEIETLSYREGDMYVYKEVKKLVYRKFAMLHAGDSVRGKSEKKMLKFGQMIRRDRRRQKRLERKREEEEKKKMEEDSLHD